MASDDLRARVRRACAEADGFDFDGLEPHDYQQHADKILAVVQSELDRRDAALGMLTARSDRCPQCRCGDCNGLLGQHTEAGCGCDECVAYPEYACRVFAPSERISLIAQQLGLLLSTHLGPRHQQRCLAVAHAAHHALYIYDYPEESPS